MPLFMFKLVRKGQPPTYLWAERGLDWIWARYLEGGGREPLEVEGLDLMGETVSVAGEEIEAVECLAATATAD
jgi:hypothetical protein